MSGQLSHPAPTVPAPPGARTSARRILLEVSAIVAVFALVGVACGFLWEIVWTPPGGAAVHGKWLLDDKGLPNDFAGTGLYFLIAALAGLVLGILVARLVTRDELVSLAAILVGSVLAAYLMWLVGTSLGPADPAILARTAKDLEPIPGDLRVQGKGAFLGFPFGSMLGASTAYFLGTRRHRSP